MAEISVIIPALNEEKYIHYPISGLERQTFKDFDTVVVDGGSQDATVKIAEKYAKVITYTKQGTASARNRGAKMSKGRILLFLDADTKPSPGLLEAYHKIFSDKSIVAATGPVNPIEDRKWDVRIGYTIVSVFLVKFSIAIGRPAIVGSNFAVRADAFRKVRGFNENFITYEDWDLSARLAKQGRTVYSDDAVVYTSARRILAWGVFGYFVFYLINIFMYYFLKRSRADYKNIR